MDECSKRELFIAAVQTLTQEEQRRLWKELEKHGIINQLGDEHIFRTEPEAIDFAKKCIKKKVKKRHFWQY